MSIWEVNSITENAVKRAGITPAITAKGKGVDKAVDSAFAAMFSVYQGKGVLYGDWFERVDRDDKMALMAHFFDIQRKFTRANTFVTKVCTRGEDIDINELFDTYIDLGVYAAMGVALITYLQDRKDHGEKAAQNVYAGKDADCDE